MLPFLTLIFSCQLIGELVVGVLSLPVPGPVLGMVLLFVFLLVKGDVPDKLSKTAEGLQRAMSLLFVPAGTGVMMHFQLIGEALVPLAAALVISTVLAIVVTGMMMRWLSKGQDNA